jgi:uncharacterized phage protein gp47/JayE
MPLPLTNLDTRTFNDLVGEGQSIIPASAPSWTDFNWSDPGITLIDLLAWLTEQDVYRLNRTTDAGYRSFLLLVGVRPRPPQVASAIVALSLKPPSPVASAALPAGIQIGSSDGSFIFKTAEAINVSPATLKAILSGTDPGLTDHTSDKQSYPALGINPTLGSALYLGFDQPFVDPPVEMRLYLWAGDPIADAKTRDRLIELSQAMKEDAEEFCTHDVMRDLPDWRLHYSARTVWEYYGSPGVWLPLTGVVDETRALTLSGPVRFMAPPKTQQVQGGPSGVQYSSYYFIRCRLISGAYECPPQIKAIALNAVSARHAADIAAPENLPDSNGRAQQTFQLLHKPVVPGSTQVTVTTAQGAEIWREEIVWDQVGPHSTAYVLSPETGQITFGDGRIGRVPPDAASITANYQIGGGEAGNVPACTLKTALNNSHNSTLVPTGNVLQPILTVRQPYAAIGGADAESLADAMARAFTSLSLPRRGVTLSDFESLALATPGVPVARAYAIANYHPDFPCFAVSGSVTVVILPSCPDAEPKPTPGFLCAVQRYIDRWRTITTEVHVIGPTYTLVSISARLHVQPGLNAQNLVQLAQAALTAFLNPLHGGPDKTGWPAGRGVYRTEILAMLNALPGVVFVNELTLQADQGPAISCDNLNICPHGFVASGQHQITISVWRGNR